MKWTTSRACHDLHCGNCSANSALWLHSVRAKFWPFPLYSIGMQIPNQCSGDPDIQYTRKPRLRNLDMIMTCYDAIQVSHGREIPKQPIFFFLVWGGLQCNARLIFSPCNQVRWTCIHCSDLYVHSGSRWRCSNPTAVFVSNNLWVASESVLTRQAVDVTHIWPWRQDVASVV